jgi:prevent-host-death family protein
MMSALCFKAKPMVEVVSLYTAKTHLSELVDRAGGGEEIIISKRGKPIARLMPLPSENQPRKPAGAFGRIIIRDDFDAPLPAEIMDAFEGRLALGPSARHACFPLVGPGVV